MENTHNYEKQSMALQEDYETLLGLPLLKGETQEGRDKKLDDILSKSELIKSLIILTKIADAVHNLPFGGHMALPWCRESFPELDQAMKKWEELNGKLMTTNMSYNRMRAKKEIVRV
jgi:hypothetical protein